MVCNRVSNAIMALLVGCWCARGFIPTDMLLYRPPISRNPTKEKSPARNAFGSIFPCQRSWTEKEREAQLYQGYQHHQIFFDQMILVALVFWIHRHLSEIM
jgi:hypothetical protein